MGRLTQNEWEKKYIVGSVKQFDQKNTMFQRWSWDPSIRKKIKDWRFLGEVGKKPGYSLQELALRRACRLVGTQLLLFNMSKPNPSRMARALDRAMKEAKRTTLLPGQTPEKGSSRVEAPDWARDFYVSSPDRVTRDIKKTALYFGADLVGICRLDRRWVYSHSYEGEGPEGGPGDARVVEGDHKVQEIPENYQYAVVMAYEEDYDMIKYSPSWIAHADTSRGYSKMAIANAHLSSFIQSLGYNAIDCTTNEVALSVPMAMQAGLGELGRNGLLITPEFGPRIRLSKVITDLPLMPDSPIDTGVIEFCGICKKCADTCPSRSILFGDRTSVPLNISNAGGALKWPVDAEKCRAYWGRVDRPCTNCVAVCPFNKPYTWFHRMVRSFIDKIRWGDPLYFKMDDVCGYGKSQDPVKFWEEWRPKRRRRPY